MKKLTLLVLFSITFSDIHAQQKTWININNYVPGFTEPPAGFEIFNDTVCTVGGQSSGSMVFKRIDDSGQIIDSMIYTIAGVNGKFQQMFIRFSGSLGRKIGDDKYIAMNPVSNFMIGKAELLLLTIVSKELELVDSFAIQNPPFFLYEPYDVSRVTDSTLLIFGAMYKPQGIGVLTKNYLCLFNTKSRKYKIHTIKDNFKAHDDVIGHFDYQNDNSIILSIDATPQDIKLYEYYHYTQKVNINGDVLWTYNDSVLIKGNRQGKTQIVTLDNGNTVHTRRYDAKTFDLGYSPSRTALKCLSPNGKVVWDLQLTDQCYCHKYTAGGLWKRQNGDIIGVGNYGDWTVSYHPDQTWIYCVSPEGTMRWNKRYSYQKESLNPTPTKIQMGFSSNIRESDDKGILVNGIVYPPNVDDANFILKVDSMGCMTPGCTSDDVLLGEDPTATEEAIKLREYFYKLGTNPFSTELTIEMVNPQPGRAMDLMLYDISGKLVSTLAGVNSKGMYQINTQELSSGMYVLNLLMDGQLIQVDKVVKQ